GTPDEQAFFTRDAARGEKRVGVGDLDHAVDHRAIEGRGPEVFAHTLDEIRTAGPARVDGARRVGADDLHRRTARLQETAHAADRAPGADSGDEVRDAAPGLAPDLRPGRLLVCERVGGIRVLIRAKGPR